MSQTIRVQKDSDNPYACINKAFLVRPDLSMKAKCLLALLLSKPDGWTATIGGILPELKEGRSAVAGAMKELVAAGYMTRTRHQRSDGTFSYETVTRETPGAIKVAILANPAMRDFPLADNPSADNRTVISNDLSLKKDTPKPDPRDTWPNDLKAAWADFSAMRVEKKKPLTPTSIRRLEVKIEKIGHAKATTMLIESVERGWLGIFDHSPDSPRPKPASPAGIASAATKEVRIFE